MNPTASPRSVRRTHAGRSTNGAGTSPALLCLTVSPSLTVSSAVSLGWGTLFRWIFSLSASIFRVLTEARKKSPTGAQGETSAQLAVGAERFCFIWKAFPVDVSGSWSRWIWKHRFQFRLLRIAQRSIDADIEGKRPSKNIWFPTHTLARATSPRLSMVRVHACASQRCTSRSSLRRLNNIARETRTCVRAEMELRWQFAHTQLKQATCNLHTVSNLQLVEQIC